MQIAANVCEDRRLRLVLLKDVWLFVYFNTRLPVPWSSSSTRPAQPSLGTQGVAYGEAGFTGRI